MTIICGDCLTEMRKMEPNSIDLTVTSPPYDNLRTCYNSEFDVKLISQELFRILKQGAVVVWVVGDATVNGSETGTSFRQALTFMENGFNLHDTMIWKKSGMAFPDSNRYYQIFEYMFVFSKGKPKTFNPLKDRINLSEGKIVHGMQRQPDSSFRIKPCKGNIIKKVGVRWNIWEISNGFRESKHPAPFPLRLAEDHIFSWSNPGDVVFDCFLGSGTTVIAAIRNDRQGIGIELSEEYCEIARKRIEHQKQLPKQMDLFDSKAQISDTTIEPRIET